MLGPTDHLPSMRRLDAYRAARHRYAHDLPEQVSHTELTIEQGHAAATRLMSHGATAIICANYALTIGVIRAARRLDLSVPGDVSVIGFDDAPAMAHTDPPLTTIRQPVDAMGRAAVAVLANQIEGQDAGTDELLFEPELVVRASTAPHPQTRPHRP